MGTLIITRRVGESIIAIEPNIRITVTAIGEKTVCVEMTGPGRAIHAVLSDDMARDYVSIGDIKASIISIDGDSVRVGVTFPRGMLVCREEVWDRIQQETYGDKAPTAPDPAPEGTGCDEEEFARQMAKELGI